MNPVQYRSTRTAYAAHIHLCINEPALHLLIAYSIGIVQKQGHQRKVLLFLAFMCICKYMYVCRCLSRFGNIKWSMPNNLAGTLHIWTLHIWNVLDDQPHTIHEDAHIQLTWCEALCACIVIIFVRLWAHSCLSDNTGMCLQSSSI